MHIIRFLLFFCLIQIKYFDYFLIIKQKNKLVSWKTRKLVVGHWTGLLDGCVSSKAMINYFFLMILQVKLYLIIYITITINYTLSIYFKF